MNTILVVDDARMVRELIKSVLKRDGWEVLEAGDGETALDLCRTHNVDLLIIDIFLPKKGGLQVMRELEEESIKPKTIAISGGEAFNPASIVELANDHGVLATFTKPLDVDSFVEAVEKALA